MKRKGLSWFLIFCLCLPLSACREGDLEAGAATNPQTQAARTTDTSTAVASGGTGTSADGAGEGQTGIGAQTTRANTTARGMVTAASKPAGETTSTTQQALTTSGKRASGIPARYRNTVAQEVAVNQIGYALHASKQAIVRGEGGKCFLVDARTNKVVYSANASGPVRDTANGGTVCHFDFSSVKTSGVYYVHTPLGRSYVFAISKAPYREVSDAMIKMLYYQRCGTALDAKCAGIYCHDVCHTGTATLVNNPSVTGVIITGGWHDAGDYGKYVTPANQVIFNMLYAYELFPKGVSGTLNIPESGNKVPDILDEARYELEWMLKMQAPSGGVYHKVTTARFAGTLQPEYDYADQILSQISLTATAGFAGSMAASYRVYRDYDKAFAAKCLTAAKKAYQFYLKNEGSIRPFENIPPVSTGVYGDSCSDDELYWAAAELFRATGEAQYETKFRQLRGRSFSRTGFGAYTQGGFGSLCYVLTPGADVATKKRVLAEITAEADAAKKRTESSAYLMSLKDSDYVWGSNAALMNGVGIMVAAAKVTDTAKYDAAIADNVSYLFGRNLLSKCYVTGFGGNSVMNPHHRPSQSDNIKKPVPGMVAGGPNDRERPAGMEGQPSAACYVDDQWNYTTNEVTIYWNSAAFFVTGYLCSKD